MIRKLALPVVALAAAAGSTYLARGWLAQPQPMMVQAPATPSRPVTKSVMVAAKPLRLGEFIQRDGVRWQEWPDVSLPASYLVEGQRNLDDVLGSVLRRPAAEGEPIIEGSLVKPGDRGFLAAVLDPGLRAISLPVDDASSSAGLIFPGDHVDLILTQTVGDKAEGQRRVSETVLADVRVLAMGRRLRGDDAELPGVQIHTATLEVSPADAEKVALVTELGRLSLSLRSLGRNDAGNTDPRSPRATWDIEASPVLRAGNQPRLTLAVIRGSEAQSVPVQKGTAP